MISTKFYYSAVVLVVVLFFSFLHKNPFVFYESPQNKWTIEAQDRNEVRKLELQNSDENVNIFHFWENSLFLTGQKFDGQVVSINILDYELFEKSLIYEKEEFALYGSDLFIKYCSSCHDDYILKNNTEVLGTNTTGLIKQLSKHTHFKGAKSFIKKNNISKHELKMIQLFLNQIP